VGFGEMQTRQMGHDGGMDGGIRYVYVPYHMKMTIQKSNS
jgi:hypothetical protein